MLCIGFYRKTLCFTLCDFLWKSGQSQCVKLKSSYTKDIINYICRINIRTLKLEYKVNNRCWQTREQMQILAQVVYFKFTLVSKHCTLKKKKTALVYLSCAVKDTSDEGSDKAAGYGAEWTAAQETVANSFRKQLQLGVPRDCHFPTCRQKQFYSGCVDLFDWITTCCSGNRACSHACGTAATSKGLYRWVGQVVCRGMEVLGGLGGEGGGGVT